MNKKVILYIAQSLDGYIAAAHDDLSFLNIVEREGEDYGYANFLQNIDTIIIGRKTFDWVINKMGYFPNSDKKVYVVTSLSKDNYDNIVFFSGSVSQLISDLKKQGDKHIFCDGGAYLVNKLLKEQLIDEIIISVIPVILGGGIKLFYDNYPQQNLKFNSVKSYESGLVQLNYSFLH